MKWLNEVKNYIKNTIVIGALIGSTSGFFGSYKYEYDREAHIPVGFSEIREIERESDIGDYGLSAGTEFYAKTNDLVMKIFESSNIAYKRASFGSHIGALGTELDMRMDNNFRQHHYEIPDLLKEIPEYAQKLLEDMQPFIKVRDRLVPTNSAFDNAWNDTHKDNYHTRFYTYDCGTNNNPQTCIGTEEVYDNTTHSYDYDSVEGENASSLLDSLIADYKKLEFNERIRFASRTNAENEDAMERSRQNDKIMSSEEKLKIANTWYSGCTLIKNLPHAFTLWENLHVDAEKWREDKNTAHSTIYKTNSHSDSGPKEFQTAEAILSHGRELNSSLSEILQGIEFVQRNAPRLEAKIKEFVAVTKDFKEGDAEEIAEEIMDLSKQMYGLNFKGGFDVEGFRYSIVFLFSMFGCGVGAGLGMGANVLLNKRRENRNYIIDRSIF